MTFHRAIGQPTREQQERQDLCRAKGCIACRVEMCKQPLPTEINHIAENGRQLGQDYTEALCSWHHRGICLVGQTVRAMTLRFGPSLLQRRAFVERYGGTEERLKFQNDLIGWKGGPRKHEKHTPLSSDKIIKRIA